MSKWISVKDRLPVKDNLIFIFGIPTVFKWEEGSQHRDIYIGWYDLVSGFWIDFDGCKLTCVSHWRHMIKRPEKV